MAFTYSYSNTPIHRLFSVSEFICTPSSLFGEVLLLGPGHVCDTWHLSFYDPCGIRSLLCGSPVGEGNVDKLLN